jgi:ABC-2 type transport system permease protein
MSRAFTSRIFATNQLDPVNWHGPWGTQAIDEGAASAILVLPPGFERDVKAGRPVSLQVLIDGTDTNNARVIQNSLRAATLDFLPEIGVELPPAKVDAQVRLWFNPGREESLFIVPGVYSIMLAIYPALLAGMAMVREKEQGTILQVYASSLSAAEFLAGKLLAYWIVGMGEALIMMVACGFIFGVGLVGDPTPLVVGTIIYLATSVLFGLVLANRANTMASAIQSIGIVFMMNYLLSGVIYPLSNIPVPFIYISDIIPGRYYVEVTRDAFVRGTGWSGVWYMIVYLAIIALLLFWAGWRSLRKMQLEVNN